MNKLKGTNKIKVEGLEDLKPGEGVRIDNQTKYEYASNLETEGVPLIDEMRGKLVAIRVYEFKMNPDPKVRRNFPTDKQMLFNYHAQQIKTLLWGDGFRPLEEVAPRVIIDSKKGIYRIFVPCEARLGVSIADRPRNLSEELAKSNKTASRKPINSESRGH